MTNLQTPKALCQTINNHKFLPQLVTVAMYKQSVKVGIYNRGINILVASADHGYDATIVFCNVHRNDLRLAVGTYAELEKAITEIALDSHEFTLHDLRHSNKTRFFNIELRREFNEYRMFVNDCCVLVEYGSFEFLETVNILTPFVLKMEE